MNILMLTPVYPGPKVDKSYTKVVHYFTKEWSSIGENVQVVAVPSFFPSVYYRIPVWLRSKLTKWFNIVVPSQRNSKISIYEIDNVSVLSIPLFKILPHYSYSNKILKKANKIIIDYLNKKNFCPDIIVAHWIQPSAYFISALKKVYNCPTVLVQHGYSFNHNCEYLEDVDIWGYRNEKTRDAISQNLPLAEIGFRCYSGVPKDFLKPMIKREWKSTNRYVFIGTFIPLKFPDITIDALETYYNPDNSFHLSMVGDGPLLNKLKTSTQKGKYRNNICFYGRIDRSKIIEILDQSDVFIMISENEAYGLSYIEAMARGCIVIASEGEGMAGIIENGVNGYLCEAGNKDELMKIIEIINLLSPEQRSDISKNARATAEKLSDTNVAKEYLKYLSSLVNDNNIKNCPNYN